MLLSVVLLACAGRQKSQVDANQGSSAGLVNVKTGLPAPDNEAAQDANRSERDQILQVLKSSQPDAQSCFAEGVSRNPALYGDLVARVDIQADGTVGAAAIVRTTLRDEVVADCVVAALATLTFPAPSKDPLVVSYPYVFVTDLTPSEVVRALYIKYGFIDPDEEVLDEDKRRQMASGEDGWYEHW